MEDGVPNPINAARSAMQGRLLPAGTFRPHMPGTGYSRLRPVGGPPGDLFPCFLVQLVQVLLDRELLAAPRAAHGHGLSADLEHHVLAACFALHEYLQST